MEFIHRVLSFGVSEKTDVAIINRIKALNAFYLAVLFVLFISVILTSILGIQNLLIINLTAIGLFILLYLLIPPYRFLKINGMATISLSGIMIVLCYLLVPELSSNIMLAFLLLFPIAASTIQVHRSLWISSGLGLVILILNFVPVTDTFEPLLPISLAIFLLIYGTMIVASYLIEKSQSSLIRKQTRIAEYYESEIKQKDEFISKLSHKLRTSLSNITLINNLVHDSRMSSAQKDLLDTLKTSTFDLINDVNDLVEITTPAIIDFKQSILSFSLSEALERTISILYSDDKFNIDVIIEGTEALDYNIIGDPSLLRSILINLIKGLNEYQLTDDPLLLSILIDYESQNLYGLKFSLKFDVENKPGLKKVLNNIHNKTEQRSSKLANANHLLTLTASRLEYSFDELGAKLYFFLDINKDSTRKTEAPDKTDKIKTEVAKGKQKSLSQISMLLVEDNAINQKIVLLSLNKRVKQIDVANNGKEALDMFGTKKYDIILMDIQMPVMDGIIATKKIREIESTSDERVPILAITANALTGDRDNCLAAGVDDYVSKPFQVDDVVDKIMRLLDLE